MDNFCCFTGSRALFLCWTNDVHDPNFVIWRSVLDILDKYKDAKERKFIVHKLPIPVLYPTDEEYAGLDMSTKMHFKPHSRFPASYVNFPIVSRGVIATSFSNIEKDRDALHIMKKAMHEPRIVQIYSREIILGLKNIHCITQQRPAGQRKSNKMKEHNSIFKSFSPHNFLPELYRH